MPAQNPNMPAQDPKNPLSSSEIIDRIVNAVPRIANAAPMTDEIRQKQQEMLQELDNEALLKLMHQIESSVNRRKVPLKFTWDQMLADQSSKVIQSAIKSSAPHSKGVSDYGMMASVEPPRR